MRPWLLQGHVGDSFRSPTYVRSRKPMQREKRESPKPTLPLQSSRLSSQGPRGRRHSPSQARAGPRNALQAAMPSAPRRGRALGQRPHPPRMAPRPPQAIPAPLRPTGPNSRTIALCALSPRLQVSTNISRKKKVPGIRPALGLRTFEALFWIS